MEFKRRSIIYILIALLIGLYFGFYSNALNPVKNIKNLTSEHKDYGSYESWLGSLTLEDHQYVLCIYTGKDVKFYPVEYLLVSKTVDTLEVQLICGPGQNNVIQLKGEAAKVYLDRYHINLSELNLIIQ